MNEPGIKLTTYFSERDRIGDRFLADELFDLYERHQMRTSVLLRGVGGFGQHHPLQTDRLLTLSESLPAVSIAIDTAARVEEAMPDLLAHVNHGLISLERAHLVTGDSLRGLSLPDGEQADGGAVKLTVYGGRSVRSDGRPGYIAALDVLRDAGAAGASVLLAVDGTLHGERRRARFFARNADVPLMLLAIGRASSIAAAIPGIVGLVDEPVLTLERVQICKSDGERLAAPEAAPAQDAFGLPIWQKIMVHAEEQAKFEEHPLHVELIRRLREAGAAGVTVLRGVRGFYADHEPFADRLLSLRRNVPVHVVAVDRPAAVQRWWPAVDELTSASGLVTSELVPASHAFASGRAPGLRLAATPTAGGLL